MKRREEVRIAQPPIADIAIANDRHLKFRLRLSRTARDTTQQYLDRSETIEIEDVR